MDTQNTEAGFGSAVVIGIIAVALLGGGAYYMSTASAPADMEEEKMMDDTPTNVDDMKKGEMAEDEPMKKDMEKKDMEMDDVTSGENTEDGMEEEKMMDTDETPAGVGLEPAHSEDEPGLYMPFTSLDEAKIAASEGNAVLFFHAAWCPSCRGLESDIKASLSDIPHGTTIIHVDYDSATALKQQYGVVRQHTLVQIDADGNKVKTLTGLTNTLEQVVSQL